MKTIKFVLGEDSVKGWLKSEGYKTGTIQIILKGNLGCKNLGDIVRRTKLDTSFLRTKLCWKTDQEYSDICSLLNDVVAAERTCYWRGRGLLDYSVQGGKLCFDYSGDRTTLRFWTIEKTIVRWIKEKF